MELKKQKCDEFSTPIIDDLLRYLKNNETKLQKLHK